MIEGPSDMSMALPNEPQAEHQGPQTVEALFAAFESPLLHYTRQLVRSPETSQEIVQETFMRLHQNIAIVRHPKAWLFRTAHNLALNHRRSEKKIVPLEVEEDTSHKGEQPPPADLNPGPDETLSRSEAIAQTRCCLQWLSDREQELIRLKFDEGLTYEQMSQHTGLTPGNVGYILHHALKKLATELERLGVQP